MINDEINNLIDLFLANSRPAYLGLEVYNWSVCVCAGVQWHPISLQFYTFFYVV